MSLKARDRNDGPTADRTKTGSNGASPSLEELKSDVDRLSRKDRLTLIVSVFALVVSGLSLALNYRNYEKDSTYKEAMLKPRISIIANAGYGSTEIQNDGPGIADVKSLTITNYKKFSRQLRIGQLENNGTTYSDFLENFYLNLNDRVFQNIPPGQNQGFAISTKQPQNLNSGFLMKPDSSITIFKFNFDPILPANLENENIRSTLNQNMQNILAETLSGAKLEISYCSISGYTCGVLSHQYSQ